MRSALLAGAPWTRLGCAGNGPAHRAGSAQLGPMRPEGATAAGGGLAPGTGPSHIAPIGVACDGSPSTGGASYNGLGKFCSGRGSGQGPAKGAGRGDIGSDSPIGGTPTLDGNLVPGIGPSLIGPVIARNGSCTTIGASELGGTPTQGGKLVPGIGPSLIGPVMARNGSATTLGASENGPMCADKGPP